MNDDNTVKDLLAQLQSDPPRDRAEGTDIDLARENIEDFLLANIGKLVQGGVESVQNMIDFTASAPDADSSESLASLIRASASSIDILQKIMISREKNINSREIAQMKIDSSSKNMDKEITAKLLLSREEVLRQLISKSRDLITEDVVEAEVEELSD